MIKFESFIEILYISRVPTYFVGAEFYSSLRKAFQIKIEAEYSFIFTYFLRIETFDRFVPNRIIGWLG